MVIATASTPIRYASGPVRDAITTLPATAISSGTSMRRAAAARQAWSSAGRSGISRSPVPARPLR